MRKNFLKTFFFIVGVLTVFVSAVLYLNHLMKELTIIFPDDDADEDFSLEHEGPIEPIIVSTEDDE